MLKIDKKIQEYYDRLNADLSVNEQISLASLILNNLAQKNITMIDESDTWTEEDKNDLVAFALQNSSEVLTEDEE
ncbi:MAG: hypothetical protein AB4041_02155 [Microcystaceae cyanobacterium]